ncbi:ras GTPase-activating protein 1-like isoform X2 [Triplophysa rosa]|uniref:ras GTPase-activating protein 1-like isoform X2 n=1 Tax=Triplophysa rosa TaxID=992332 RepID=UPI002545EE60|nr:ras GTPase-activating protein 1-like isoform X2 [Triplophysa rosa]
MEVRGEDRGSDGSRGPDSTHFPLYSKPARVRVTNSDVMIYPSAGEDLTGRATSAGCESPSSDGPGSSRMSPTDGPTVFPPLPPPPPPPPGFGVHGSVDESDQQDGPEYEEEEVVFPLSAPPTNHSRLRRMFISMKDPSEHTTVSATINLYFMYTKWHCFLYIYINNELY